MPNIYIYIHIYLHTTIHTRTCILFYLISFNCNDSSSLRQLDFLDRIYIYIETRILHIVVVVVVCEFIYRRYFDESRNPLIVTLQPDIASIEIPVKIKVARHLSFFRRIDSTMIL